jgi:putative resolvase
MHPHPRWNPSRRSRLSDGIARPSAGKIIKGKVVIGYCRVSTSKQANDLLRQIEKVRKFCLERFEIEPVIFSEVGSGLSVFRRKYLTLIEKVVEGSVSTVVFYSKDRLSRFGINSFQFLCETKNVDLIFIENVTTEKSYEQELAEDILSILHVYSCRHYGRRGSDALRKHVSDVARERITELKKEGYSVLGITRIMDQEGFKYENHDSPISRHIVRKLVYEIAKEESLKQATGLATGIKDKNPSDQKSLVDQFIEEKCVRRDGARVFSRELFESFDGWAKSTDKEGLTRRNFSDQIILSGFRRGKSSNGRRAFFGLEIKNQPDATDPYTRHKKQTKQK